MDASTFRTALESLSLPTRADEAALFATSERTLRLWKSKGPPALAVMRLETVLAAREAILARRALLDGAPKSDYV